MPSDELLRRDFFRSCVAGTAAAALPALAQTGLRRPNILYIHSHDSGRYLQPYGHAVPAPNLQRLAEGGVLFRHAFSAAPTCSPSRASLLTGMCPHSNGMLGLAHRGSALHDYRQHLLHTLRPAGYHSALIGLQHIAKDPATIGYDQVTNVPGNHVEDVAPLAAAFLAKRPAAPFFLTSAFSKPIASSARPVRRKTRASACLRRRFRIRPQTRADIAAFKASARVMDEGVGVVLKALEANGLAENTLVISTTDHGISFPAMKCNLTDHGMGVSLIMRGPGGFSGGKVNDAMVSHLDIFPTICELLDIEKPAWLEGASLTAAHRGPGPRNPRREFSRR